MEILFSLLAFAALIYGLKRYLSGTKKKVDYPVPGEIPPGAVIPDLVTIPDQPIQVQVDAAMASAKVAPATASVDTAKKSVKKEKAVKKPAKAKATKTAKPKKPKMTVVK